MLKLPLFKDSPAVEMVISLEETSYQLTYTWNQRSASWYLDVATQEGVKILSGIRIQHRWSLWARYRAIATLPPGELVCISMTDDNIDPSFASFGRDTILLYYLDGESVPVESSSQSITIVEVP
jgi:hypothetical protein